MQRNVGDEASACTRVFTIGLLRPYACSISTSHFSSNANRSTHA